MSAHKSVTLIPSSVDDGWWVGVVSLWGDSGGGIALGWLDPFLTSDPGPGGWAWCRGDLLVLSGDQIQTIFTKSSPIGGGDLLQDQQWCVYER